MKNEKKFGRNLIGALLALAVGLASFPSLALAATEPRDLNGKGRIALEYIGCKPARVTQSANGVLGATGSGMLYWIQAFGTAATVGKGVLAFDTINASVVTSFQSQQLALSPIVYGTSDFALSNATRHVREWVPSVPVRFENGLWLLTDSNTVSAIACYRLDSGVNP